MGDVVDLHQQPLLHLEDNQEFLQDCCRFFENILSEETMRRKYKLADSVWESLGSDEKLIKAIEDVKVQRMRDGSSKIEKAQQLVLEAPEVLHKILVDNKANAKHKIDSAKTLNDFATPRRSEAAPDSARFIITINLGEDHVEHYNKSIEINADDTDPNVANIAKYGNELTDEDVKFIQAFEKD